MSRPSRRRIFPLVGRRRLPWCCEVRHATRVKFKFLWSFFDQNCIKIKYFTQLNFLLLSETQPIKVKMLNIFWMAFETIYSYHIQILLSSLMSRISWLLNNFSSTFFPSNVFLLRCNFYDPRKKIPRNKTKIRCDNSGENRKSISRLASVRCPGGLAFDIESQTCNWKTNVKNCKEVESKLHYSRRVH